MSYRLVATRPEFNVSAYITPDGVKADDDQIGSTVCVQLICPVLTPQEAVAVAVEASTLTARDATPLAVKLGAAAAQESAGKLQAAVSLLRATKQQIVALVNRGDSQPQLPSSC